MAFAPLVLPSWNVEAPALLGRTPTVRSGGSRHCRSDDDRRLPLAITKPSPDVKAAARPALSTTAAATGALRRARGDPTVHHRRLRWPG